MENTYLMRKVGASTIMDVKNNGVIVKTLIFNKNTNFQSEDGIQILIECGLNKKPITMKFAQIENNLSATDIPTYITAACTAGLFNPNA